MLRECGGLGREGGRVHHGRAVERHVDEAGAPARGKGGGAGAEAFPLLPPRFIQVDMCVDIAGQDKFVFGVERHRRRALDLRPERHDFSIGDGEISALLTVRPDQRPVADEEIVWRAHAKLSRNRASAAQAASMSAGSTCSSG